ncbi:hypothetical protein V6Z12_D09G003200 [Gossypium hirsutum]
MSRRKCVQHDFKMTCLKKRPPMTKPKLGCLQNTCATRNLCFLHIPLVHKLSRFSSPQCRNIKHHNLALGMSLYEQLLYITCQGETSPIMPDITSPPSVSHQP